MQIKVLYIEDELSLAKIVKESLQGRSFDVLHLENGANVVNEYARFQPDVCVLDVMLPIIDGFSIGKLIRNIDPKVPIIYLTAKNQTNDILEGFKSGGNDYLKKPFSLEELIVRINNLYTICQKQEIVKNDVDIIKIGQYHYYPTKLELVHENEIKRISYREAEILMLLVENKNQIVERKLILDKLWGDNNFFNSRNLDVYITKLRSYFKKDHMIQILTLKAIGYRLIDQ